MRFLKALLVLVALAASDTGAAGWNPLLPAPAKPVGVGAGGANVAQVVLLSAPFTTVGGAFTPDANTVSNVTWNGASIVDPYNTWTQNGTVPQVTTSPWYPNGFSAAPTAGAGAFSDTNYYSLGTGSDVLDFTGDFSCCFAHLPTSSPSDLVLLSDWVASSSGWYIDPRLGGAGGVLVFQSGAVQSLVQDVGGFSVLGGANVICAGRGGSTGYLKQNLRAVVTSTAGTITPATSTPALLGRWGNAGFPYTGNAFSAWCSSTTPADALFTAIQNRLFGHIAATGQTFTVTRATTATAEPKAGASPSLYAYPANILRITENGALLESATTNVVLQSEAIDSASWASVGTPTVTADQYAFPTGQTTMEKIVTTVAGNGRSQAATVSSSTGPFTVSSWVRSDTGTATESVVGQGCATVSTCTCAVSSGSCTGSIVGASCVAFASVGTAPVRLAATYTCALAVTSVTVLLAPGQFNTTAGTGGFGGAQLETAGYASSYVPTTTATVARNADVVSVANPLPVGPFCVTGTWVPALAPFATWSTALRGLWSFGVAAAANSARVLVITDGTIRWEIYDGTATLKQWNTAAGVLSGTTTSTITLCSNNAGSATATVNGATQSFTPSGAGTGVLSTLAALRLDDGGAPTLPIAAVKNFKICRGADPVRCQ